MNAIQAKKQNLKPSTRGVLAGAYKSNNPKSMLTHVAWVQADGVEVGIPCKVQLDNLGDEYSGDPGDTLLRPTCSTCAKAWDKFHAQQL